MKPLLLVKMGFATRGAHRFFPYFRAHDEDGACAVYYQ